jgi:serine protease
LAGTAFAATASPHVVADAALLTPAVSGFIVQWHDGAAGAPQTEARLRAMAARGGSAQALRAGAVLTGRWQRLVPTAPLNAADAEAWAVRLRADPAVKAVVPDVREQRQDVTPADGRYSSQWWLQAVAAGNTGAAGFTTAWSRSTGLPLTGNGAVVAVLDSGITSHPELNAKAVPGYDFVSDTTYANDGNGRDADASDPGDAVTTVDRAGNPAAFGQCPDSPYSSWHGTTIAGQLAAVSNNTEGVAAGNWYGRVLPVRVAGKCGAAVGDIIDGLRWAAGLTVAGVPTNANPARVVVLSYGGADSCDLHSSSPSVAATAQLYRDTLDEVRRAGTLVVVAAGNARSAVGRPASCPGALAVTATNREGYKANYANLGPEVALATPGGDGHYGNTCDGFLADTGIVSTGNLGDVAPGNAGYVAASGTSFAAPAVASVASLMLAVNPALTLAQLEDGLKRSARPHVQVPLLGACALADNAGRCACTTSTCGAGLLDAPQALAFAAAPGTWVAPARTAVSLSDTRLRNCASALGKPVPEEPVSPAPEASADAGGGAASAWWVALLALAVAALARPRRQA